MGYTAAQDFGFVARIVGAAVWLRNRTSHTAQSERSRVAITFFYCLLSAQVTAMLGFHQAIGAVMTA